jgi:mannose-1-phosphate guanylyltransferase
VASGGRCRSRAGLSFVKALILAGGLGTRLRPLTFTRPKHLLPIANRPHIEHVFDLLLRHSIDHVVMLSGHLHEAFKPVLEEAQASGLRVDVSLEEEPLGTAGAFKNAERFVTGERFLAFNGDVLTDIDLTGVVRQHARSDAEATIVLTAVDDPSAFGVVSTDDEGRVLAFVEKPSARDAPSNLINAGIYVFEPSVLERIPRGEVWSAEHRLFPDLVEEGARLFAHADDAYWMDIGTPEKYLEANLDALIGKYRTETKGQVLDGVLRDRDVEISSSARVSRSTLGPRVRVDPDATVEDSVLLPGVSVGAGARVVRSILGEDVAIAPGSVVQGRALGDGAKA